MRIEEELRQYSARVLDHFHNPRNLGDLEGASATVMAENPFCRDRVKLSVAFDGRTVREVRVKILGCTIAIAASSVLTELIQGKTLEDMEKLNRDHIVRALEGVPEQKLRCLTAPLQALGKVLQILKGTESTRQSEGRE